MKKIGECIELKNELGEPFKAWRTENEFMLVVSHSDYKGGEEFYYNIISFHIMSLFSNVSESESNQLALILGYDLSKESDRERLRIVIGNYYVKKLPNLKEDNYIGEHIVLDEDFCEDFTNHTSAIIRRVHDEIGSSDEYKEEFYKNLMRFAGNELDKLSNK